MSRLGAAIVCLMVLACVREGDEPQLTDALLDCHLLTPGRTPALLIATSPYQQCIQACVAQGSCSELTEVVCSEGNPTPLLDSCTEPCLELHGHHCDGEWLIPDLVCDGFDDCSDASDEVDCPPPFVCDDSTEIAPRYRCDGLSDCPDASDEVGCPSGSSSACNDGTPIPNSWVCDGRVNCSDDSDENGCAMLICPDSNP